MRYLFLLTILLISICCASAQTTISGKLLDEQQQPISNVSVSYRKVGSPVMLGFSKTDDKGVFKLEVKVQDLDSLQLDFNHMGYAKRSVIVGNTPPTMPTSYSRKRDRSRRSRSATSLSSSERTP